QGSQGGGPEQKKQPQSGAGRPGQRRRRRRGGRGRRGQGRNPQAQQRAPENESIGQGQSVRTVRSTDGAAGATSSGGQVPRHGRGRPAAKSGPKPGGARSGAKPGNAGKNAGSGKNARGGRGNNRHQRGGQRLRTVLETSAGGAASRGRRAAAAPRAPAAPAPPVPPGGRADRQARSPQPHAVVDAQGAHRAGGDCRGDGPPRGARGDGRRRHGARPAGHHRLLVRGRGAPHPQDGPPPSDPL